MYIDYLAQGEYFYRVKLALNSADLQNLTLARHFPDGQEAELESITFPSYKACADSFNNLFESISNELRLFSPDNFIITWEANPELKNDSQEVPNLKTAPWKENELLRLYLINLSIIKNSKNATSHVMGSLYSLDIEDE